MADTDIKSPVADIPGGPFDIEFFFDPACPFAWLTSRWIKRVQELRSVTVGWRFISLKFINEGTETSEAMKDGHNAANRYHRICAAAREQFGNDTVSALYSAFGEKMWYSKPEGDLFPAKGSPASGIDVARILADLGLPAELIEEADNEARDVVLRAETELAFSRTGADVGTPIITYDPPNGNSLFGPVISSVPDDEMALRFYDAMRTMADFPAFSELKRTKRAPLDLPLFN